ncbi:C2 domain-containing protein [Aureococcus anophagefferens]|nr:C2 domain-containing protein [Aureococcus anophagefferens]
MELEVVVSKGRGLLAMDTSMFSKSSSDPYVVVVVEGKEIGRTEVITKSLNPCWSERTSFRAFVAGTGPVSVELRLFDKDKLSRDARPRPIPWASTSSTAAAFGGRQRRAAVAPCAGCAKAKGELEVAVAFAGGAAPGGSASRRGAVGARERRARRGAAASPWPSCPCGIARYELLLSALRKAVEKHQRPLGFAAAPRASAAPGLARLAATDVNVAAATTTASHSLRLKVLRGAGSSTGPLALALATFDKRVGGAQTFAKPRDAKRALTHALYLWLPRADDVAQAAFESKANFPDAYVVISVAGGEEGRTNVDHRATQPRWRKINAMHAVPVGPTDVVDLEVRDWSRRGDSSGGGLGRAALSVAALLAGDPLPDADLSGGAAHKGRRDAAPRSPSSALRPLHAAAARGAQRRGPAGARHGAHPSSDPYVVVLRDGVEVHRTKTVKKNLNPTYDDTFEVDLAAREPPPLPRLTHDRLTADDAMGEVNIDVADVEDAAPNAAAALASRKTPLSAAEADQVRGLMQSRAAAAPRPIRSPRCSRLGLEARARPRQRRRSAWTISAARSTPATSRRSSATRPQGRRPRAPQARSGVRAA